MQTENPNSVLAASDQHYEFADSELTSSDQVYNEIDDDENAYHTPMDSAKNYQEKLQEVRLFSVYTT